MNAKAKKKMIKVRQVGSTIGRPEKQELILRGLGLRRIGQERLLEDTPSIRGMVNKVSHLVVVEDV
ncbi:MAG: 50S ribosomal protein L30 [Alphaproteobacteria bacterium]|nr:50S ribosomal protein L30 [Alphaproteobacteria bacterium]NCB50008.1 50S ribosomal protein L30 [Alphaproteobacteria bacterium]